MYARVTLLEVDTVRTPIAVALEVFKAETLPRLRTQAGYRGVWVLTTPEGKGLLMSLWDTEDQADPEGEQRYYSEELSRMAALFRSPPGREQYEVAFVDEPAAKAR